MITRIQPPPPTAVDTLPGFFIAQQSIPATPLYSCSEFSNSSSRHIRPACSASVVSLGCLCRPSRVGALPCPSRAAGALETRGDPNNWQRFSPWFTLLHLADAAFASRPLGRISLNNVPVRGAFGLFPSITKPVRSTGYQHATRCPLSWVRIVRNIPLLFHDLSGYGTLIATWGWTGTASIPRSVHILLRSQ